MELRVFWKVAAGPLHKKKHRRESLGHMLKGYVDRAVGVFKRT